MNWWPFVSRARFNDLKERFDKSESERKLLLDRLAALGLGGPIFERPAPQPEATPAPAEADTSKPRSVSMVRRPSQIVAQRTREAFSRFRRREATVEQERGLVTNKTVVPETHVDHEAREIALRQFDQVETEVRQGVGKSA